MNYCSGKQAYRSMSEATRVRNTRERYGASKLRIYECSDCHGFHLTSQTYGKRYG